VERAPAALASPLPPRDKHGEIDDTDDDNLRRDRRATRERAAEKRLGFQQQQELRRWHQRNEPQRLELRHYHHDEGSHGNGTSGESTGGSGFTNNNNNGATTATKAAARLR
jgi:hypothetical protein